MGAMTVIKLKIRIGSVFWMVIGIPDIVTTFVRVTSLHVVIGEGVSPPITRVRPTIVSVIRVVQTELSVSDTPHSELTHPTGMLTWG